MDVGPGRVIDRYVVEDLLGEGGMAVVFRVRHLTLGTRHALKVLKVIKPVIRQRMLREGQMQASLRHRHIVAVSDVLEIDGAVGLVLEYVEGPTLRQLYEQTQPTLAQSLAIFRGVCAGVAHAHARGLVHRDLKPDNVLMSIEEGRLVPKVSDFGLVKALNDAPEGGGHRTSTGATMGTPAFMSPEQINDSSRVDRRTDMWSLGCILYAMLCGKVPFDQRELIPLFRQISIAEYKPLREIDPTIPERVEAAIAGLLTVDPRKRIADCAELLRFLDGVTPAAAVYDVDIGALPDCTGISPDSGGPFTIPADGEVGEVARAYVRPLPEIRPPAPPDGPTHSIAVTQGVPATAVPVEWSRSASSASSAGVSTSRSSVSRPDVHVSSPSLVDEPVTQVRRLPVGWLVAAGGLVALAIVAVGVAGVVYALPHGGTSASAASATSTEPPGAPKAPTPPTAPSPTADVPSGAATTTATTPETTSPPTSPTRPSSAPPSPSTREPRHATTTTAATTTPPTPPPVEPAPVEPAPVTPAAPTTGHVAWDGADSVWLVAGGVAFRSADVPAGRYEVHAAFPDDADAVAGSVTVTAGADTRLHCVAQMKKCVAR